MEHKAVAKVFPGTVVRLCVWHVVWRAVVSKLTKYFSKEVALRVNKLVWGLVRNAGFRDPGFDALKTLCDAVTEVYQICGSPVILAESHYNVANIQVRIRNGEHREHRCIVSAAHN